MLAKYTSVRPLFFTRNASGDREIVPCGARMITSDALGKNSGVCAKSKITVMFSLPTRKKTSRACGIGSYPILAVPGSPSPAL